MGKELKTIYTPGIPESEHGLRIAGGEGALVPLTECFKPGTLALVVDQIEGFRPNTEPLPDYIPKKGETLEVVNVADGTNPERDVKFKRRYVLPGQSRKSGEDYTTAVVEMIRNLQVLR